MGFTNAAQQEAAIQAAAVEQEKRRVVEQVYAKFPGTIVRCMANERHIISIIERWAGPDVIPSLYMFEEAIRENPSEFDSLAQQQESKTREQLSEQIISLLAAGGKAHDAYTLQQERTRLKTLSTEALHVRLADIQRAHGMAHRPVTELKAIVAESRVDHRRFPGFPELPKTLWHQSAHVPVNALFFRGLDGYEIRRWNRLYSVEQVNQRIKETQ
jgi:hypothetical protein